MNHQPCMGLETLFIISTNVTLVECVIVLLSVDLELLFVDCKFIGPHHIVERDGDLSLTVL